MVKKQNVTQTPNEEAAQITLANKLRKRVSRAKDGDGEQKLWDAEYDFEKLTKDGGLIDIHESRPFVDVATPEELLHTCRIFALAMRRSIWFRKDKIDAPDIQPEETIGAFCYRITNLWYKTPAGSSGNPLLVSLQTLRFDDDLGIVRPRTESFDAKYLLDEPTLNHVVDVSTLPQIGERWEKEGFGSYGEWKEHVDEEERKKKNREILDKNLKTQAEIDRMFNAPTEAGNQTPRLLYRGTIHEN